MDWTVNKDDINRLQSITGVLVKNDFLFVLYTELFTGFALFGGDGDTRSPGNKLVILIYYCDFGKTGFSAAFNHLSFSRQPVSYHSAWNEIDVQIRGHAGISHRIGGGTECLVCQRHDNTAEDNTMKILKLGAHYKRNAWISFRYFQYLRLKKWSYRFIYDFVFQ